MNGWVGQVCGGGHFAGVGGGGEVEWIHERASVVCVGGWV
jgi:hypothetical protein